MVLKCGDRVDEYVIDRELGSGGMSVVYEATHAFTQQRIALKQVHPKWAGRSEAVDQRLPAEVMHTARLELDRHLPKWKQFPKALNAAPPARDEWAY